MEEGINRTAKYKLNNEQLRELNVSKEVSQIGEQNGLEGIAEKLFTDIKNGLNESPTELNERQT